MSWSVPQQHHQPQQRPAMWQSASSSQQAQWQTPQMMQQQQQQHQGMQQQHQGMQQQHQGMQQQHQGMQQQHQGMQQQNFQPQQPGLQQGQGQGRMGGALQPTAVGGAGGGSPTRYVVMSRITPEKDQAVVRTLTGEYSAQGENHGRTFFKKEGPEGVDVYMYYWDARDGPAFQGWWFGNQVGGTQVWSHNGNESNNPPTAGWKIPWDGPVSQCISVVPKPAAPAGPGPAAAAPGSGLTIPPPGMQQSADRPGGAAGGGDNSWQPAPGGCRRFPIMGGGQNAADMMRQKQEALQKQKEEALAKQKALEEQDMATFEEFRPDVEQRANGAEDAVEKAVITAELINAAGEDMEEVQSAVAQTEAAVQEAQKVINEARLFMSTKSAVVRKFKSQTASAQANAIILQLQKQLQEAQTKLNPLKTARQDFQQRQLAQKLVTEVLDVLGPAELDVDRAEEASATVAAAENPKDMMIQAEELVNKANSSVSEVLKMLEMKMKVVHGHSREELGKLEERCRGSLKRLNDIRSHLKEGLERVACETIVSEASAKLESVSQAIFKAAEAENPFLMGVEQLPIEDTRIAVKACETAVQAANASVSIARMFLATKSVEAKRFSKGPSAETLDKLKEFQERLEVHIKRLTELKSATAKRKKDATMREAELEVANAEAAAKKVTEVAAPLEDEQQFYALSAEEVRKAADETSKAEAEANSILSAARKYITTRQIEAKGKDLSSDMSSELIKYQTRLSQSQAQVAKYKKLITQMEQKVRAKQVVGEAISKISAAEEKVGSFAELVESLMLSDSKKEESKKEEDGDVKEEDADDGKKSEEELAKKADATSVEAALAIKTMMRFLEAPRSSPGLKEEILKLTPRARKVQDRMNTASSSMKEKKEKVQVKAILDEAEQRVSQAEENINKVKEAENPFLLEGEAVVENAGKALAALEEAISGAQSTAGGTKTFLAMKRLAVKRLEIQSLKDSTTEALVAMQARLDLISKSLAEAKSSMADRKTVAIRREMVTKVDEVESKVSALTEAMEKLPATSAETTSSSEEMKEACEKVGQLLKDAESANSGAKSLLDAKAKEMHGQGGSADTLLQEISALKERLTGFQKTLDSHKATVRDQEHLFVAQRLKQDSTDIVEKIEKQLAEVSDMAKQFTAENGTGMSGTVYASMLSEFLKQHIQSKNTTVSDLFKEMIGGSADKKAASEEDFVTLVTKLLDQGSADEIFFTEEQQKTCFKTLLKDGSTELSEEDFSNSLHSRYVVKTIVSMTDQLVVKGGKTVKRLAVNEVVEALEPASKEPSVGIQRVRCRAQEDGKEGWISLSGSQGTEYLRPFSVYDERRRAIDQSFQKIKQSVQDGLVFLDAKLKELNNVHSGPLDSAKGDLKSMKPKLTKVQSTAQQLQKEVAEAEKQVHQSLEDQKRKRQEAAEKKAIAAILDEVSASMAKLRESADEVLPAAEALATTGKPATSDGEDPVQLIKKLTKDLETLTASATESGELVKSKLEDLRGNQKGNYADLRSKLTKEKGSALGIEGKCKKCSASLATVRQTLADEALREGAAAFYGQVKESGKSLEAILKDLGANDKKEVLTSAFKAMLLKIPSLSTKASLLDIALERYGETVSNYTLAGMLQDYRKCLKDIAVTTTFEVAKDTKTIRKLAPGELVEVVESGKVDTNAGLHRVRCRALIDCIEGWVTVKGNQGTAFLETCEKPFYKFAGTELKLQSDFQATSKDVRAMVKDEVFELLEGPKKEPPVEVQRVKVKAKKDGKTGFVTFKDAAGSAMFEQTKLLVCKASIALTGAFDITGAKAIRKLTVGETMEPLEEEQRDENRGLRRIKVRTTESKQEGWVTIKGNQGTAFVEPSSKLHACKQALPLQASFSSGSEAKRSLEEGELVETVDDPRTEVQDGAERVRGRSMTDGVEGWFTLVKEMQRWSPNPAESTAATAQKA